MKGFGINSLYVFVEMNGVPHQQARVDHIGTSTLLDEYDEDGNPINVLLINVTALNKQEMIELHTKKEDRK